MYLLIHRVSNLIPELDEPPMLDFYPVDNNRYISILFYLLSKQELLNISIL